MPDFIEFGIRHIPSGEIFEGFDSESEALEWLAGVLPTHPDIELKDCETVQRERTWTDWHEPVSPDTVEG